MVLICIPLIAGEGEYFCMGFFICFFPSMSMVVHCECALKFLCVHACKHAYLLTKAFILKDL